MSTEVALVGPAVRASRRPSISSVVGSVTARKAVRSGALWGYVFGAYTATQAYSYASAYKTPAERKILVHQFAANSGISALVGPARAIDTVAGFTVWKCMAVLTVVGGVWAVLIATRLTRGEEDAGRWELFLAGRTTPRAAFVHALAGLGAGLVVLWSLTALVTVLIGRAHRVGFPVGGSLFFALASVSGAAMFLGAGALAAQLATSRRQAAGYAGAFLGACYGLRMVADSGIGLDWLRWTTPLGWVEQLQPMTGPRPWALVPIAVFTGATVAAAVHLAGARDLGAGTVPEHSHSVPHTRLLGSHVGLALRNARGTLIAWGVAIGATGLLIGSVAKSAGEALESSPTFVKVLTRIGATGGGAAAYIGMSSIVTAFVLAFVAAGQVTRARAEESDGRLDHLLVRPVSRHGWLTGRSIVAFGALVTGGLLFGLTTALGASSQRTGVSVADLAGAGLNVVAPAVCILGLGMFVLGAVPRAVSVAVYSILVWSLLVELVGSAVNLDHWILDTSVFHHMTPAPAVVPDWSSAGIVVLVGIAGVMLGAIAFTRRDVTGP